MANSVSAYFKYARRRLNKKWLEAKAVREWRRAGQPAPVPHPIKRQMVKQYAARYGLRTFVETGTYKGAMVESVRNVFEMIYSIELDPKLFALASKKFSVYHHITILQGDSGIVLGQVVPLLSSPALFWLDGHYSGGITSKGDVDTPIQRELQHILGGSDQAHVLLIDDARNFHDQYTDYPSIESLAAYLEELRPGLKMAEQFDIIAVTPS